MTINEIIGTGWIKCTEKDSPYYNRKFESLSEEEKEKHMQYVNGEISYLNYSSPGVKEFNERMMEVQRDDLKKSAGSSIRARDCWVD